MSRNPGCDRFQQKIKIRNHGQRHRQKNYHDNSQMLRDQMNKQQVRQLSISDDLKFHKSRTPQKQEIIIQGNIKCCYSPNSHYTEPKIIKCPMHFSEQVSYICKQGNHLYFCCSSCLKYHQGHLLVCINNNFTSNTQNNLNCVDHRILKKNCYRQFKQRNKILHQLHSLKQTTLDNLLKSINRQFDKIKLQIQQTFDHFFSMFQGSLNKSQYEDFVELVSNLTKATNYQKQSSQQHNNSSESIQKVMNYIDKIRFMHKNQQYFEIKSIKETLQLGSYLFSSTISKFIQENTIKIHQTLSDFRSITKNDLFKSKLTLAKKQLNNVFSISSLHFKDVSWKVTQKIIKRMRKLQERYKINKINRKICRIKTRKQKLFYMISIQNSVNLSTFNERILDEMSKLRYINNVKLKNCIDFESFGYIINKRDHKQNESNWLKVGQIQAYIQSQYQQLMKQQVDGRITDSYHGSYNLMNRQNKQQQNINKPVNNQIINGNNNIIWIQDQSKNKGQINTENIRIIRFKHQEILTQDSLKYWLFNSERLSQLYIFGPTEITYMGLQYSSHKILNITHLTLVHVKISQIHPILQIFSNLKHLRYLSLYRNDWVDQKFLRNVSECSKKLERLSLLCNKNLDNDSVKHLSKMKNLKYLFFSGQTKVTIQVLVESIKECKSLKTVILHSLDALFFKDSYQLFECNKENLRIIKIINCPNANTLSKVLNNQCSIKEVDSLILKLTQHPQRIQQLCAQMIKHKTKQLTIQKSSRQLLISQINQLVKCICDNFSELQILRIQTKVLTKELEKAILQELPRIRYLNTNFDYGYYLKSKMLISQFYDEDANKRSNGFYKLQFPVKNLQVIVDSNKRCVSSNTSLVNSDLSLLLNNIKNSCKYQDLTFHIISSIEKHPLNELIECLQSKTNPKTFVLRNLAKPQQSKQQCRRILSLLKVYHNIQTLLVERCEQLSDSLIGQSRQSLKNLKNLHISHNHCIKGVNLQLFVNLKVLALNNCPNISSIAFLQALEKLKNIQFLEINGNFWLTDQIFLRIIQNYKNKITHLGIKGNKTISRQALVEIKELKYLEYLNCGKTKMNHKNLVQIAKKCLNLTKLVLYSLQDIEWNTLQQISKHVHIQYLDISFCQQVNDQSMFSIVKHLKWINIQGSGLSDKIQHMLRRKGIYVVGQKSQSSFYEDSSLSQKLSNYQDSQISKGYSSQI